jgi:AcrR family transcriptional regulator
MSGQVKGRRSYDASGRQEQARLTRLAVVRAAYDLFVEKGYGRTTIGDVARAAAFGSKAGLLHRVWDVTIGGDDDEVVYHERPEIQALQKEADLARRLEMQARLFTSTAQRVAPFLLAVQGAASSDEAAAQMLEEMGRQRLHGLSVMAAAAAATGQLAVSQEHCRDIMWSTTDGVLWHRLVQQRGWSDDEFAQWLAGVWIASLVR